MADTKNVISFLDSLNRCIFCEVVPSDCTEQVLTVKNPVVVNVTQQRDQMGQPTGQMALQLVPIFFREFLADPNTPVVYQYNRKNITELKDAVFNFKLYAQYEQIFAPVGPVVQPSNSAPATDKVINLFD